MEMHTSASLHFARSLFDVAGLFFSLPAWQASSFSPKLYRTQPVRAFLASESLQAARRWSNVWKYARLKKVGSSPARQALQ